MGAQLTISLVDAYVMTWHRRSGGAEWDVCPACALRVGLEFNQETYPERTPEDARRLAVDAVGGEKYYCPECQATVTSWDGPFKVQVPAVIEHFRCKIF